VQGGMIGVPVVIVRVVVSAPRVLEGVAELRCLHRNVAIGVDAQHHAIGAAEAAAREDREGKHEGGKGAPSHGKRLGRRLCSRWRCPRRAVKPRGAQETLDATVDATSVWPGALRRRSGPSRSRCGRSNATYATSSTDGGVTRSEAGRLCGRGASATIRASSMRVTRSRCSGRTRNPASPSVGCQRRSSEGVFLGATAWRLTRHSVRTRIALRWDDGRARSLPASCPWSCCYAACTARVAVTSVLAGANQCLSGRHRPPARIAPRTRATATSTIRSPIADTIRSLGAGIANRR
jgi:hypothetical protein